MKLTAIIEIPKGSKYKYEFGGGFLSYKHHSSLCLDRVLNQTIPYNYGFLPDSAIQPDNDKLDIFVISNESIPPLTNCKVNIIGGFKCFDNGIQDDKLVGTLDSEDVYPNIAAIRQYLETYKEGFKIVGQLSYDEAIKLIEGDAMKFPTNGAV